MEANTLPGCFTLYPKALPPNNCSTCRFREDCQKYMRKEALKLILTKIEDLEQKLRG
jgi:putative component of membrane protein insertase Oxa1/YidC/SpoIIIJ protein YidD